MNKTRGKKKCQGCSRLMTYITRGSGKEVYEISRVGSGRVGSGRVGSGDLTGPDPRVLTLPVEQAWEKTFRKVFTMGWVMIDRYFSVSLLGWVNIDRRFPRILDSRLTFTCCEHSVAWFKSRTRCIYIYRYSLGSRRPLCGDRSETLTQGLLT